MMQSLQNESWILRTEVEHLWRGTTVLDDKFQSVEVISKTIQTDTNLLKKEFEVLKEENRSLSNMTLSTEQNLENVQSDIKERFTTVKVETADLDHKL